MRKKLRKLRAELRESLRTQPAWILKNLQDARGGLVWKIESIEEIDVIRLGHLAMRGVRADSKIVYDGSRYAATSFAPSHNL